MADPDRWSGPIDPRLIDGAAWAALVFGASETAIALLTSTPGPADTNVLTNAQIAAARDVIDRYAGTGRVLTHTIVHPNLGSHELDAMERVARPPRPVGLEGVHAVRPADEGLPHRRLVPRRRRDRHAVPRARRTRSAHGSSPRTRASVDRYREQSVAAASPRDIGPAAAAFPDISFVVYHSGYERDPSGQEGPYDAAAPNDGVDRLIRSVETAGIGAHGNVYAELGSTWFLMLRRPLEAAHVLGKLLVALGPERIVWGTDSTWYGSPQSLIDAFRAFRIPERLQDEYGYPPLTADVKEQILSANAQRLYGVTDAAVRTADEQRDRSWVTNASAALRARDQRRGRERRNLGSVGVDVVVDVGVLLEIDVRVRGGGQQERAHVVTPHAGRRRRSRRLGRERDRRRDVFVGHHPHEGSDHDERQDHEHHCGNDHARTSAIPARKVKPDLDNPPCGRVLRLARVERGGVTLQRDARPAVDADGRRARDRHPLGPAVRVAVVDDRAVLRRPVVPDRDVAETPVPAHGVLRTCHDVLERADDRARQVERIADEPVREAAEEQRALTGLGMHRDGGMLRAVDRRDELHAALEPRRVRAAAVDAHVAWVRSCG